MAARIRKGTLTNPMPDVWKKRISATKIIDKLNDFIFDKADMSKEQIAAANILLKKVAPDLSSVEMNADVNLNMTWAERLTKAKEKLTDGK